MKATIIIAEIFVSVVFFPLFLLLAIGVGLIKVYKGIHRGFKEAYIMQTEEY